MSMYIQNQYMQILKNQSVAINLMRVSIFDLVKPPMVYISHFANKVILNSEIIICCSFSNRGERITFLNTYIRQNVNIVIISKIKQCYNQVVN